MLDPKEKDPVLAAAFAEAEERHGLIRITQDGQSVLVPKEQKISQDSRSGVAPLAGNPYQGVAETAMTIYARMRVELGLV
ncbi:MAG: hypothetical protein J0L77_04915 [Alphaproteobacteria bacterium]|nr:hypothetical protein [Alphaproteobacteria bacterium]